MGVHDRQIQQLRNANAKDDQTANVLAARLKRESESLSPRDIVSMARQIAALGDAREARAELIAKLEAEGG
jgi:hypothetical protein